MAKNYLKKIFSDLEVKYLLGGKVAKIVDSGKFISAGMKIIVVDADFFQYFISTKKELYRSKKHDSTIPHLDKKLFFQQFSRAAACRAKRNGATVGRFIVKRKLRQRNCRKIFSTD